MMIVACNGEGRVPDIADSFSYSYWLNKPHWSEEEAFQLLCGLDPEVGDERDTLPIRSANNLIPKWRRLAEQARAGRRLPIDRQLQPVVWMKWAQSTGCEVPSDLAQAAHLKLEREQHNRVGEGEVDPRARNSYLKIILALLHSAKMDTSKPTKTSEVIAAELKGLGIILQARTIATHIKQALQLQSIQSDEEPD